MTSEFLKQGGTVWLTGLSGAGKTTTALLLAQRLRASGARVEVLDGDNVRQELSRGLGYTKEDRDENVRRIGFVCETLARHGIVAIAAAVSPYREARDRIRGRIPNFVEVHLTCPIEILVERDVKGLYKRALAGELRDFTGISAPYEAPIAAEVTIDSSRETPEEGVEKIFTALLSSKWER